jgi:3-oxosteroid 1-dehydrogenase
MPSDPREKDRPSPPEGPIEEHQQASRREFLGGLAAFAIGAPALVAGQAEAAAVPDERAVSTADVVVVGSGAAGLSAAIAATRAGASVVILEKAPSAGGTTIKSDGAYWIPNNHYMRAKGLSDPKADAINYMVRGSYPFLYRSTQPRFGIGEAEYRLIETYYDNAFAVIEDLENASVLKSGLVLLPDYQDHWPQDKAPRGRVLLPLTPSGELGRGRELVRQLSAWLDAHKVPFLYKHRVTGIARDNAGKVIGVSVDTDHGSVFIRARRGVVFGSGGFTHDPELMLNFQAGPVWGGCAVPTNQGDLIRASADVGAKLGNMANAWRAELILEDALESPSVARDVWQPPGDSMLIVNKYGERVYNEKRNYHERARVHFTWDPLHSEYPNKLLFMIYDQRTAELYAGNHPLPEPGGSENYVIAASRLEELGPAIQQRLNALSDRIGDERLSESFKENLLSQISRFNSDADRGIDGQFSRGKYPYDAEWHTAIESIPVKGTKWRENRGPNVTLYPLDTTGPFQAIILGAGTLDTNGGPVINEKSQILDVHGRPIPCLYGAGNCVASPAAAAYWGAGGTIGPAITFGTLAGRFAAAEASKEK